MPLTWFVTGSSRGLGRALVEAALERGDRVAATARDTASLAELTARHGDRVLPLPLDVTDRSGSRRAVDLAVRRFGRLDAVVNNAGHGQFGAIEELSESEIRSQLETNFFGALWVTQAALPVLRRQRSGHLVQMSSVGGVGAFPMVGGYNAAKWALEGMSESLAAEVAAFGIRVTIVEPSTFATGWRERSNRYAAVLPAYVGLRRQWRNGRESNHGGDPAAAARALLQLVDTPEPPLRLLLGADALPRVEAIYSERLATWRAWREVSGAAGGTEPAGA